MRRYYPEGNHGNQLYSKNSVERLSIDAWHRLWVDDRSEWYGNFRDRPKRFDSSLWQRAIALWKNDIPHDSGTNDADARSLSGVPFLVKDLYDVPGERTTCSSAVLLDDDGVKTAAARSHAWLSGKFIGVGAHIAGRTNMNEFAYGLDGRNIRTGNCPHPLDRRRISGGSSSGSAWAVASGVVPFALGTDTGGSVRLPAVICGIFGIRLSWSEERLQGVFPLARSLDTVGWFSHSGEDMARLIPLVVPSVEPPQEASRIALVVPPGIVMTEEIARLWRETTGALENAGFTVNTIDPPHFLGDDAVDAYNIIGSSEAWDVHREWIGTHGELYDPVVRGLIERGKHWNQERRQRAEEVRTNVRRFAASIFESYDFVILPATVRPSPLETEVDGTFRSQIIRLNAFASLGGLPALAVPMHFDAVRSGGIQIVAPNGKEPSFISFLDRWNGIVKKR